MSSKVRREVRVIVINATHELFVRGYRRYKTTGVPDNYTKQGTNLLN